MDTPTQTDALAESIAATTAKLSSALEKDKVAPPPSTESGPAGGEPEPCDPEAAAASAPEIGPEASVTIDLGEEAVAGMVDEVFNMTALALDEDHWRLEEYERDNLAKAAKAVLDYYAVKMTPVTALVFWAGMTIAPRAYMSLTAKKEKKAAAPEIRPPVKNEKAMTPAPEVPKDKTGWSADDKK